MSRVMERAREDQGPWQQGQDPGSPWGLTCSGDLLCQLQQDTPPSVNFTCSPAAGPPPSCACARVRPCPAAAPSPRWPAPRSFSRVCLAFFEVGFHLRGEKAKT